ncbi:MAG: tRNA pseudouridine(55) synthase TruB [Tissierellia bacterium]|nr:tRNA pseudouridine(55) synthase TruB [Tissierellia bacterium]
MINAILPLNKEISISSQKAVSKVKKRLNCKKVGHAGTLDLEASGLLIVLLGKATKLSDYIMHQDKEYIATIELGKKTNTLDYAGEIIKTSNKKLDILEIKNVLKEFEGDIKQIPPMFSAIKHNGKKLYELALEGKTIKRKERVVRIYQIKIIDFNYPILKLQINCSKGTYIRTLADDIGEKLGTYGFIKELIRTKIGQISIEQSIDSSNLDFLSDEVIKSKLIDMRDSLYNIEELKINDDCFDKLINGVKIKINNLNSHQVYKVICKDEFIGIGIADDRDKNYLKMKKVLYEQTT